MKLMLTLIVVVTAAVIITTARGATMTNEQIIRAVFPDNVENQAIRVASCESTGGHGLNRWAHNSSGATGLFQIMPGRGRPPVRALYNPWVNVRFALALWHGSGRTFWPDWQQSARCWA